MKLYETWLQNAYNQKGESLNEFWDIYIPLEQKVYEYLLKNNVTNLKGSLKELSSTYNLQIKYFVGFLDGLTEVFNEDINLEEITEDTILNLTFDFEVMFKKMVEYKAEHLYNLPEWTSVFSQEQLQDFYKAQKKSTTIVKEDKIGRNEPCPCGSGKKFKKCCGNK